MKPMPSCTHLSDSDIYRILDYIQYTDLLQKEIAVMFGVADHTISKIRNGRGKYRGIYNEYCVQLKRKHLSKQNL
jgi:hypothetical protein